MTPCSSCGFDAERCACNRTRTTDTGRTPLNVSIPVWISASTPSPIRLRPGTRAASFDPFAAISNEASDRPTNRAMRRKADAETRQAKKRRSR
jgi:hypothetical protein